MQGNDLINIFGTAFIICLVLGIVSLAASILLFFKFDIRGIYDLRTGRGAKRIIEKMEEINAMTGKLRQETVNQTPIRLSPKERIVLPKTSEDLQRQEEFSEETLIKPKEQPEKSDGTQETALLHEETKETTLLNEDPPETTVLSAVPQNEPPAKRELPGPFKIEKEVIWIHTKEII